MGVITGLACGVLCVGGVIAFGPVTGATVGLPCAALAVGGLGWIVPRTILARAAASLANLTEEKQAQQVPMPLDHGPFDAEIDHLREVMTRVRSLQQELARSERTVRTFWNGLNAAGTHGRVEAVVPEGMTRLQALLDRLLQTAVAIHRDASSLDELNERIALGAADQSEAVARTASAVEALSEKIDRIGMNAEEAAQACEDARVEARQGLEQVHSVIEGMDRLLAQIEVNGRKTKRLEDRSHEIGNIVDLIRGISSRTDMLALNATIESVRAGEHGRGFAVVAEEIRKLAERTAMATREISAIVEAIQLDTHESIKALSEEELEMHRESERVRETGSALERISQVAERSARLVEGISRSTNDQVLATQDLVRAMQRISEVTHQTQERTTQSRSSLRGLVASSEPWQRLTATATLPVPEPTSLPEPSSNASPPGLMRKRRGLVASEQTS
jgi:twitching motility protein PilJ